MFFCKRKILFRFAYCCRQQNHISYGGDHEQFEACQLEAENIAAYWIESLLDVDYFDFGGITIHGWPVNARLRAETDPLAVIAADATQL